MTSSSDRTFPSATSPGDPMMDHRFIFVAGLHRSGTTLVFKILRDHPKVSGFRVKGGWEREHEGQVHQSVYPPDFETGGAGYFCLNPESAIDEQSELATPAHAKQIFSEWSQLWDLSKPYLLEKTPANLIRTRFLQSLFPNSYFIVIVRHPIAVSLATLKWMGWPRWVLAPDDPKDPDTSYSVRPSSKSDVPSFHNSERLYTESMYYTLFEHWKAGHERYEQDAQKLRRWLVMRYEDLVRDPNESMGRVYRFLDLPDAFAEDGYGVTDRNERYFGKWETTPPDVLSPGCRRLLSDRYGSYFARYGYRLTGVRDVEPMQIAYSNPNPGA